MDVSVRELKNRLSEYLRRASAGEEIVVTSRGKPVGRLVGPGQPSSGPETEAVTRLLAQPWIRPGNGKKLLGSDRPTPVPAGTTDSNLPSLIASAGFRIGETPHPA